MSILVIGGSSFIGVYTVQAFLDAGYEVFTTGRNARFESHYAKLGVSYRSFDLADEQGIKQLPCEDVEGVVLLAALLPANSQSDLKNEDNAWEYLEVNSVGTARLLEYCRRIGIKRLITTASYADVQCSWSSDSAVREDWTRNFEFAGDHAAYVISKNAANDICTYYNSQHGMKNVIFRLPPVYGVGPHGSLMVNGVRRKSGTDIFIERAKLGEPIFVYGDGSIKRDIVYVKDVAQAFVDAMESDDAVGLYNIGSGVASSFMEQAQAIARVFAGNNGVSVVENDRTKENGLTGYFFDISKAQTDFGYAPRYAEFEALMRDWKKEEDRGVYPALFQVEP